MKIKKRLDVMVHLRGLAQSREQASAIIISGNVFVDGQRADKPGEQCRQDCLIEIKSNPKYVSRGGLKLEKAIETFGINLQNLVAVDVGASTGGFTDCMLKYGCVKVYAIDVGYGQLAWNLRQDSRVINLERNNIRFLDKNLIRDPINFFTVDVSFISLCLALSSLNKIIIGNDVRDVSGVCLIKPQFEAGKGKVGKNGVIRDAKTRVETIEKVICFCLDNGFTVKALDFSPIRGPKGNIEFLIYLIKTKSPCVLLESSPQEVEELARKFFGQ
ncbi:MAG: TlyA family RNA methyltransferase [Oscillospiraceae bacterium]|jgi:23S rRNA (cytidine1920-2'-O)/16S rRNA (cytidine1409-2'-O)-methyltransferase|nr:TlyA family RNA methyltransferase [Oscillospiraceae bacterium]